MFSFKFRFPQNDSRTFLMISCQSVSQWDKLRLDNNEFNYDYLHSLSADRNSWDKSPAAII